MAPTQEAIRRGLVPRGAKAAAAAAGIALLVFVGGFIVFANRVVRYAPQDGTRAEGIVVLTGGEHRLAEAAALLRDGRGKRLLISGANRVATPEDLHRMTGLTAKLFACCVDIGYAAHDTIGNADETSTWASRHGFSRLIIVTSSYHMPRTLTELGRTMPRLTLIPHPVVSRNFRTDGWWRHFATARILFTEYVKFLPSAARLGIARVFGSWSGSAHASGYTSTAGRTGPAGA
jgi:uncharacterized SAM-binding protein YcdF (DUF218 family)